ncbi:MAG: DNA recombination protein RmuC, partial [Gammaproteobacteria bacterium]
MDLNLNLLQQFSQQSNGLLILLTVSFSIGLIGGIILRNKSIQKLTLKNSELTTQLSLEKQSNDQLDMHLDQVQAQLSNTFNQLSNDALSRNNEQFLKLAEENLKRYQSEAKAELNDKEKAIEQLIKPINDALSKTATQIQ